MENRNYDGADTYSESPEDADRRRVANTFQVSSYKWSEAKMLAILITYISLLSSERQPVKCTPRPPPQHCLSHHENTPLSVPRPRLPELDPKRAINRCTHPAHSPTNRNPPKTVEPSTYTEKIKNNAML